MDVLAALSPVRWFRRKFDVRPGEGRLAGHAFLVLLLIIGAHTVLETARDALLLERLSTRSLGVVYLGVAALTLPSAALAARVSGRFGARRGLAISLVVAGVLTSAFFVIPPSQTSVIALYIVSGLIAAHLVPQFWALAGRVFTVAEGRRLIAPIASAGVVGGLVGSSLAAGVLLFVPVRALTLIAAGAFLLAAGALGSKALEERNAVPASERRLSEESRFNAFKEEPFLTRIALLVVLSTMSVLAIDYLFKWTVASSVPSDRLGHFFAVYYAVVNALSLLVQLLVGGPLVRRMGVALAVGVTPTLLLVGGIGVVLTGGMALGVYVLRGIDGSLRHSVHRITTELVYFPVPAQARDQAKPLIDGTFARLAQATMAASLLALAASGVLSRHALAVIVVGLCVVWLLVAATLRGRYLALFRRALSTGALDESTGPEELDISSAEVLVERLASRDPDEVAAAMLVLARRGRERLIPALVLYHKDERVLVQALSIFGASKLETWIALAEPLLEHPKDEVRMAAARALASHGRFELLDRLLGDSSSRVQGYAVLHLALRDGETNLLEHPRVSVLLKQPGHIGEAERVGLLAALADAAPDPRFSNVLLALATDARIRGQREAVELLARAASRQRDPALIEPLIGFLGSSAGREAVRTALLELREPAFLALARVLIDPSCERRVRVHVPRTIARFGTQRAFDLLLSRLENEPDGLVRYKCLRGIGRLVAEREVRVDRRRIEKLALVNLQEHFRLVGLRSALSDASPEPVVDLRRAVAASRLLAGLLDDKIRQSLERAFRLVKIAHTREDIHRVYLAMRSSDKTVRANAGEFLDTLLTKRDQQPLRELFRLVTDELDGFERAQRAEPLLASPPPTSRRQALLTLIEDADLTVASLAGFYAGALGDDALRSAVERARGERPSLAELAARMLRMPSEPEHA